MASNKFDEEKARESILKTLVYHDIFDFPLTKEELWTFLIADRKIDRTLFDRILNQLDNKIIHQEGYFALNSRKHIIERRKKNSVFIQKKLDIAKKAARILSLIPTVQFIGISGGLAIGDADNKDDVDFFMITKKNSLFRTRLMSLFILEAMGLRRKRIDKNPANKICLNFLIDTTSFSFFQKNDLYTAHEITQLMPLFDRDKIHSEFLKLNNWVFDFLPNAKKIDNKEKIKTGKNVLLSMFIFLSNLLLSETLSKFIQKIIIKRHIKSEIVTNHLLAFNPNDYRMFTLNKLRLKMREIGLLTSE